MRPATPADRLIVALDTPDPQGALDLAESLAGALGLVKVGLELFVSVGPSVVRELQDRGHDVFLDLKLHDIPNTVAQRGVGRRHPRGVDAHRPRGGGPRDAGRGGAGRARGRGRRRRWRRR